MTDDTKRVLNTIGVVCVTLATLAVAAAVLVALPQNDARERAERLMHAEQMDALTEVVLRCDAQRAERATP